MSRNSYAVSLSVPTEPLLIYEIQLKLTFEEYLCLMASVVSLWFGFSIIMLTEYLSLMYRKINNYYNRHEFNGKVSVNFNAIIQKLYCKRNANRMKQNNVRLAKQKVSSFHK